MRRPVEHDRSTSILPCPFRFRRMALDDLDRVMEIEKSGFAHPWSADLLRREMMHDWSTVLVAAETRRGTGSGPMEALVGFIVYDELHVLNIATAPEERRRGVAKALMNEAAVRARRAGAVLATLEVRRTNVPAIGLYRALGYRQVGIRVNYYVDEGEDAIVMAKDL